MPLTDFKKYLRAATGREKVKIEDIKKRIFWGNILVLIFAVVLTNLMPTGNALLRILFIGVVLVPCLALLSGIYRTMIKPSLAKLENARDVSQEIDEHNLLLHEQVEKILAVIKAVANGDLSQRVDIKTEDEIGALATMLNQMIDNLDGLIKRETLIKEDLQHSVTKLLGMVQAVEQGDLTKQIVVESTGEISQVFAALNNLIQSLRRIVQEIRQATARVATSGKELSKIAQQSTATITQVANTITQISTSMSQISQNAQAADTASQQTLTLANKGTESIQKAIEGTKNIKTTVDNSALVIRELGRRSTQIGEIITVITKIADQTNLLSLNAAIEAARAGELGRGFAVVADEVRKLAEGSAQSASEISRLISEVQGETQKAVSSVERGAKQVEDGVLLTFESAKAFKEIADSAKNMAEQVQSIAAATEETAAGAEEASASSEEQVSSVQKINSSTAGLNEVANQLQEIVEKFKV